jgi:hypothetical protein
MKRRSRKSPASKAPLRDEADPAILQLARALARQHAREDFAKDLTDGAGGGHAPHEKRYLR